MLVTEEERRRGSWDPERRAEAITEFRTNGCIIIENALPADLVEQLRERYFEALDAKRARFGIEPVAVEFGTKPDTYGRPMFKPMGGNHDINRWNMHLPSRKPFLDSRVVANPFAMEILDAFLGPDAVITMLASDAAFPGSQKQEIHQDAVVSRFALNIPVIDFTEENGATEIWPGTHRSDPFGPPPKTFDYDTPPLSNERIKELVAKIPGKRVVAKAGSILLRDHRVLHRGMENRTQQVRPMLSLLYFDDGRDLPFKGVTNLAARAALWARETARKLPPSPRQAELLSRANAAGRIIEFAARSDRDYRRVIPRNVWNDLSPRAQRLLRHASVEGDDALPPEPGSMRASVQMVRTAFGGMSAAIGGRHKAPPGGG